MSDACCSTCLMDICEHTWQREKQLRRERDELADALRVYLQAGHKETRRAASVIAKAALAKVTR